MFCKSGHRSLSRSSTLYLEKSNFIIVTEVLRSPHSSPAAQVELTFPHSLTETILINASENGIFPGSFSFCFPKVFIKQLIGNPWNTNRKRICSRFSENLVQVYYKTLVRVHLWLQGQQLLFNMEKYTLQSSLRNTTGYFVNDNNRLSIFPLQICINMATKLPCYQDTVLKSVLQADCHLKATDIKLKTLSSLKFYICACMQKPINTSS